MSDTIGTVLVTGGAGFIGCALAQRLAPRAERWVVLDVLHPQVHADRRRPADLHESAELVEGDVTDAATWDDLLSRFTPDVVIHLAAETGTAQSLDEASRHALVNVVGTTRMTDAFARAGVLPAHVLLSSSRAVYGEGSWRTEDGGLVSPGQRSHQQMLAGQWDFPHASPIPSSATSTVPSPTSVYGATKLAQENILRSWGGSREVPVTVLRLQNVYGPGQSLINSYTGIVSLFSQLAAKGDSIPLYEDGRITRDFVYIDDVVSAFEAAVLAGPDVERGILDVGSGEPSTIQRMAEVIAEYHGAPPPHIVGLFRDGDVRFAACSIGAIADELDFGPRWSLVEGVAALQKWIAEQDSDAGVAL